MERRASVSSVFWRLVENVRFHTHDTFHVNYRPSALLLCAYTPHSRLVSTSSSVFACLYLCVCVHYYVCTQAEAFSIQLAVNFWFKPSLLLLAS